MKIHNETEYRTREIKSLLVAVHDHLAKAEGRLRTWRWLRVRVAYTRTQRRSGHARLDGSRTTLRFVRPEGRKFWREVGRQERRATAKDIVELGWHEFLHLYGYRHENMARYYPDSDEVREMCEAAGFEPGDALPLYAHAREEEAEEDQGPTEAEKYEEKLRHALQKRKEWTSKAKRAKTGLQRWRERENRARRKLEALGVDVDEITEDELGGYEPAMAGDIRIT